jgi:hypothetical protein
MRRRQGRVLGFLPEWEGPAGGFFAGRRDHYSANATVRAFVDSNKPVANETTQVARQRGSLKALKVRQAGGRNRAGLNQRRQQGELGASNAGPSHCLLEGAGQIAAMAPRGGADALPAGDEVNFFTLHNTRVYTPLFDPSRPNSATRLEVAARRERSNWQASCFRIEATARTTISCRKSEIRVRLPYEQPCAFAFQDRWLASPPCERRGQSARKIFSAKIPCKSLISLVSDERIQGIPRKSNSLK